MQRKQKKIGEKKFAWRFLRLFSGAPFSQKWSKFTSKTMKIVGGLASSLGALRYTATAPPDVLWSAQVPYLCIWRFVIDIPSSAPILALISAGSLIRISARTAEDACWCLGPLETLQMPRWLLFHQHRFLTNVSEGERSTFHHLTQFWPWFPLVLWSEYLLK